MEKRESSRWLSDAEAMRFAFALSEFRIDNETGIRKPDEPFKTVSARIEPILDLIEEFAPVHFATLWKCKTRGGVISAIARSKGYDPKPRELPYEYVCSLNDRRRWKMVSITIIQQFADILRSINDEEDRSSIEDELRQLEPLRYLLESVAEENVVDTIKSLQQCVALAEGPKVTMSKEMFDILIDAIDAQNEHIQDDLDPDDWQPMRAKLQDIKERAQAAQGAAKAA